MCGETPVVRVLRTARSDKRGAAAIRSEEYLHRWRRNPKPSPWVKPESEFLAMGGDVPVACVRCIAGSDNRAASAMATSGRRYRWRRNPEPPAWVKPQSRFISMGREMPVARVLRTARSDKRGAAAVRSEEYLHGWRRNPKPSPWVKPQSKVISMGGETPVARVLRTARSDKRGAAAIRSEEYLHRWRRDPKPSPWVEPESEFLAMGGDVPVACVPCIAGSDNRGASAMPSEGYRHRWLGNPKLSPWVKLLSNFFAMGGDMPVAYVPRIARSDKCSATAMQSEEHHHTWR